VVLVVVILLFVALSIAVLISLSTDNAYWSSGMMPPTPKPGDEELFARSGEGMIHWIAFEDIFDANGNQIADWQTAPAAAFTSLWGPAERSVPASKNERFAMFCHAENRDWARCLVLQGYPLWVPEGGTKRYFFDPQRLDRNLRRAIGMHDARPDVYGPITLHTQWGKRPGEVGGYQKFVDEFYGPPLAHIAHCKSRWPMPGERPRWSTMSPHERFTLGLSALTAATLAVGAVSHQSEHNRVNAEKGMAHSVDWWAVAEGAAAVGVAAKQYSTTMRLKGEQVNAYTLNSKCAPLDNFASPYFTYPLFRYGVDHYPSFEEVESWKAMEKRYVAENVAKARALSAPAAPPAPPVPVLPAPAGPAGSPQLNVWVQGADGRPTQVPLPPNMAVVDGQLVTFQPVGALPPAGPGYDYDDDEIEAPAE